MWVFFPFGFFSIVAKPDNAPDELTVRARSRVDLAALIGQLPARRLDPYVILWTPENDYPFRIVTTRRELAVVLEAFVLDELHYDNFKSEVARVTGTARVRPLHDVWEAMRSAEDADARRPVVASEHEHVAAQARRLKGPRRRRP
jgi:hypothetical protein